MASPSYEMKQFTFMSYLWLYANALCIFYIKKI